MSKSSVGLIRGLRAFLGFLLFLGVLGCLLYFIWIGVGVLNHSPGTEFDISMPAALGEGTLKQVIPLTPGPGTSDEFGNIRVVDGRGELRFETTEIGIHLGSNGALLLGTLIVLWEIFLLERILSRTAGGEPFHPKNVRGLNLMGWITLGAGLGGPIIENLLGRWIIPQVQVVEIILSPWPPFRPEPVLVGLLLLVLSSVWRQGAQMAEEQSLTV